jgi:hypothetical protein
MYMSSSISNDTLLHYFTALFRHASFKDRRYMTMPMGCKPVLPRFRASPPSFSRPIRSMYPFCTPDDCTPYSFSHNFNLEVAQVAVVGHFASFFVLLCHFPSSNHAVRSISIDDDDNST